jgi:hypothetical protein
VAHPRHHKQHSVPNKTLQTTRSTQQGGESGEDHGRNQVCQRAPTRRLLAYALEEAENAKKLELYRRHRPRQKEILKKKSEQKRTRTELHTYEQTSRA